MDEQATVLTVEEAARRLKISRGKAYAMTQSGELPSVRVGVRSVRIPEAALRAWLEARTREVSA